MALSVSACLTPEGFVYVIETARATGLSKSEVVRSLIQREYDRLLEEFGGPDGIRAHWSKLRYEREAEARGWADDNDDFDYDDAPPLAEA